MTLLNAADPERFRIAVGNYSQRWYHDPLPGCAIAEASDWKGPSISTVKKASGSDWTNVAIRRIANSDANTFQMLAAMTPEERANELRNINNVDLRIAAGRGTIVHIWAEDMLAGNEPQEITPLMLATLKLPAEALEHALEYRDAIVAWFDQYQPELIGKELVVCDRGLHGYGYGGTADAWVKIGNDIVAIDWKTRTPSSRHGGYPEEGAQIAAACTAEYCIVDDDGSFKREQIPDFSHGLIVSIKPEGCESFPVDLDRGREHWVAMHAWWTARRSERESIGKKLATVEHADEVLIDSLEQRAKALAAAHPGKLAELWPAGVPTFKHRDKMTAGHCKKISVMLDKLEADVEAPFQPAAEEPIKKTTRKKQPKAAAPTVDDTEHADERAVAALQKAVNRLTDEQRGWIAKYAKRAKELGAPVSLAQVPSVRRFEIGRMLLEWAIACADDDMLTYALNTVKPEQSETGERVARLSADDAKQMWIIANHINNGESVAITDNQTLSLKETS